MKPVDPFERGEFDGFEMPPRPVATNYLGLKSPITDSAARCRTNRRGCRPRSNTGVGESIGIAHRQVLRAAVTVIDQPVDPLAAAIVDGLLKGIEDEISHQGRRDTPADDASVLEARWQYVPSTSCSMSRDRHVTRGGPAAGARIAARQRFTLAMQSMFVGVPRPTSSRTSCRGSRPPRRHRSSDTRSNAARCAGNSGQCAPATPAFTATVACRICNLQNLKGPVGFESDSHRIAKTGPASSGMDEIVAEIVRCGEPTFRNRITHFGP